MRFLVTGAGGQLGREVVQALEDRGREVLATDRDELDVGDRDAVVGAVTAIRPDVVVNAAGWTDVDGCESDVDRAFRVNAIGVRHLADGCRRAGAHLVHISTDYVFDGRQAQPYTEWDACNPLSVYGRSKRAGELEVDSGWTIVRTAGVFGRGGRNIVKTILELAGRGGPLRFVDDQRTSVTAADDLARIIRLLAVGRVPGTFHVTNQGATTWLELARAVLAAAGDDPSRVSPISTAELGRPAARPAMSVLDNAALRLGAIPLLPDHREPLERLVKELTAS